MCASYIYIYISYIIYIIYTDMYITYGGLCNIYASILEK